MIYDFDPLYSAYPKFRNQTLKFLPSDTEERYEYCKEKKTSKLLAYGWYDKEIDYTFNSYGFRSDEFEDPSIPSILFLGCSYTLGVGISIEDSFTNIVSKELKLKNYNLGLSGGGSDSSFRMGHHWIPKLKPKYVVFANIFKKRCEEIENGNKCKQIVSNYKITPETGYVLRNKNVFPHLSNDHWEINNLRGLYALKHVCHECDVQFYHITEFESLDLARDLAHPGKLSNEQVAEELLTQIQNRGD